MYCNYCGKQINRGDSFCKYCGMKIKTEKMKKFIFWKTFVITFLITLIISLVFFGFLGSFEENFVDSFMGILIMSLMLAIPFTFFIKWIKEYRFMEKSTKISREQNEKIKKWKKQIKNAGISTTTFGWLLIILIGPTCLLSIFYLPEYMIAGWSDIVFIFAFGFVSVVLGNRIKTITDSNIKKYLEILLFWSGIWIILSFVLSEKIGIILIIFFVYLILGYLSVKKLLKVDEYKITLTTPEYKIKKKHWIILAVIIGLLFTVAFTIDIFPILIEELSETTPEEEPFQFLSQEQISAIVLLVCIDDNDFVNIGSGVIINSDEGNIFTNRHVVSNEDGSVIKTSPTCYVGITDNISQPPKLKYLADIVAYSPKTDEYFDFDIAVLDIYDVCPKSECEDAPLSLPSNFPFLEIGYSENLIPGSYVEIAGYPTIGGDTFTLTEGIISGRVGDFVLKTDAKIDEGNSGGAALDEWNLLIGIPSYTILGTAESIGYIIDIDSIYEWYNKAVLSESIAVPFE